MYPVIRPELSEQSKAVWCSPDRSKAWLDLALRGKSTGREQRLRGPRGQEPRARRGLGVNSTPTLIFANGERVAGGLAAADLQQLLDSAKR